MKTEKIARISHAGMRDGTHIDIEVCYQKELSNYRGVCIRPRGYYLSATPVTPHGYGYSHVLGTEKNMLLFETSRFSEKKMIKAVEMGKAHMPELIELLLAEQTAA